MTLASHQNALPPGTALMEVRLTGLLGAGAFGTTYLARDAHLEKDVAIKKYLASGCAARTADGGVVPITQQQGQGYRWGLDRFSQEARTLARFSHPHIVRVNRYFEANGTGYMVMDYERGESLKAFAQTRQPLSEAALMATIGPLLDGLEEVHKAGFLHRDIKPDYIFDSGRTAQRRTYRTAVRGHRRGGIHLAPRPEDSAALSRPPRRACCALRSADADCHASRPGRHLRNRTEAVGAGAGGNVDLRGRPDQSIAGQHQAGEPEPGNA